MKADLASIKALREETGASVNDCRMALEASGGDPKKAREFLRQRGSQIAKIRQDRATVEGRLGSYLHHDGKLAALVEVNCESDYVARTDEFKQFCKDVAMQVAAMNPRYLDSKEHVASDVEGPEDAKASSLLEQPFVKDPSTTVQELLAHLIAKTGEQVVIRRFVRLCVGEPVPFQEGER